ncbi:DUF7344 domain-containing protein [Halorarum salinum]|uniref:DUF7344 domain-containing protein n=1 Tax=Halorarum salinum TaxID=2743089 RepID=A0A7D5LCX3_9EURY|nr:hypothetical protein [Halobaculum salinum]QLG63387.1 hypothetical protein HUG12_17260 [Halobaculum salinum]
MSSNPDHVVSRTDPTDSITVDALFAVLRDRRRREALSLLVEHDSIALADLADELAVAEFDARLPEIPPAAVKRIYVSLYHDHVPRMADAGLVAYSQERDVVALVSEAERLVARLLEFDEPTDGRSTYATEHSASDTPSTGGSDDS